MSDERLQEIRRRLAQGDLGARSALLAERVRVGDLAPERLDLAAYVGDEDARHASGASAAPFVLHGWVYGLDRFGVEVCVRVAIAAARSVLHIVEAAVPTRSGSRDSLLFGERWLVGLQAPVGPPPLFPRLPEEVSREAHDASCAAEAVHELVWSLMNPRGDAAAKLLDATSRATGAMLRAIDASDESTVRIAIRDELVPWALGEHDPVRQRVEASEQPSECTAIVGESRKPGDEWATPDRCGKPGWAWRGPNSTGPSFGCPDHAPTNPSWLRAFHRPGSALSGPQTEQPG